MKESIMIKEERKFPVLIHYCKSYKNIKGKLPNIDKLNVLNYKKI